MIENIVSNPDSDHSDRESSQTYRWDCKAKAYVISASLANFQDRQKLAGVIEP